LNGQRVSEAQTRYSLIDPQLRKAGWNLADRTQVAAEIPVAGYDASPLEGVTDYCLYRPNGEVLAVVEAKRTSRDPRVGKQQVLDYVTAIAKKQSFRPFAFMANGEDIWFWETDAAAERRVAGFFSRENLERLLFLKQNRLPISSVKIKDTIVNRSYQVEAIRRISETLGKKKKRKALLVMATGTGKTRTIMALIDVFLKAHAAQRVLFLADRDALVDQASPGKRVDRLLSHRRRRCS
jgi:type I restriction enzyme, R subunit